MVTAMRPETVVNGLNCPSLWCY